MEINWPRNVKTKLFLVSAFLIFIFIIPVKAQDTIRPEIYGWGIDGTLSDGTPFTIWANVTDDDSGIYNVTANIRQDFGIPVVSLMTFNSSFYTINHPGVELNHTYLIWVEAYDTAGNVALSYNRNFDLRIDSNPQINPFITFPYVVSVSVVTFFIAIGLSYEYNKRNPRPESSDEEDEMGSFDSSQ